MDALKLRSERTVKQCAVLIVSAERKQSSHPSYLRETGFLVHELRTWPRDDGTLRDYHVVVVRVPDITQAPMLAARLRARPHFGRRLLVALVNPEIPLHDRRSALASGFDDVVNVCCESRELTARLLRGLRARPELRCALPPPLPRRSAA